MQLKNLLALLVSATCLFSTHALAWNVSDVEKLYDQLMGFKDTQAFKQQGFAPTSPYHQWLTHVQEMSNDSAFNRKMLVEHGIVVGDLLMLGQEYRRSHGRETDYSRYTTQQFESAFKSE